MAEYIEREAAIDAIMKVYVRTAGYKARERVFEAEEAVHRLPVADVEKLSDGYHTFADLYEQRLILSAALAKDNPHAWKSKRHEDGSVPFGGGWFIIGFDTDEGCYTYHYELKDWDLFQCEELDKGKPWDGHTSKDIRRLLSIPAADVAPVVRCKDCKHHYDCGVHFCDRLGMDCPDDSDFFCSCGEREKTVTTMPNQKNRPDALPDTEADRTRWWAWYDCDARCPWRTPSGCRADALELQPSAAYGTNCRRRQPRRRKKEDTPNA